MDLVDSWVYFITVKSLGKSAQSAESCMVGLTNHKALTVTIMGKKFLKYIGEGKLHQMVFTGAINGAGYIGSGFGAAE